MVTNGRSRRGAVEVDGLGEQFLAGAGLAVDEDGGIGLRGARGHVQNVEQRGGMTDDVLEAVLLVEAAAEQADLLAAGSGGPATRATTSVSSSGSIGLVM